MNPLARTVILQALIPAILVAQAQSPLRARFLGVAGWEITDGKTVLLIDPYVSRPSGPPADETPPRPDWRGTLGAQDLAVSDTAAVDRYIARADYILLTHAHYVHMLDVPYIARTRNATVIGNESVANIARGCGVSDDKIITVRGGEDFEFETFSVRVVPSLHSATREKRYFSSGIAPRGSNCPLRFADYVEGGTFGFLVRFAGSELFLLGSMNYIEREVEGLRPDVAFVPSHILRRQIYDYTGRLMRALGQPRLVIATHWDDSLLPYGAPLVAQLAEGEAFRKEVRSASPQSRVIIPKHLEPIALDLPPRR